jgi:hypothetical protein
MAAPRSFLPPNGARFCSIAFSDRGDKLYGATTSGSLYAFYLQRNKFNVVEIGSCALAIACSKRNDGEVLLGLSNGTAVCVQMRTQARVCTLNHSGPVSHVDFECHGHLALTGSSDSVILWNSDNWTRIRTLGGHSGVLQAGFFGAPSEYVALLSNNRIFMWDLQHYQMKVDVHAPKDAKTLRMHHFAVSDNGKTLAAVCDDVVCLWDLSNDNHLLISTVHTPSMLTGLLQIRFSPGSERRVAILAAGGAAIVFAGFSGQSLEVDTSAEILAPDAQQLRCFELGAHGQLCATCCATAGTIQLHELGTGGMLTSGKKAKACKSRPTAPKADEASWLPLYQLAQLDPSKRRLNRHRLRALLHSFGQFPSKHRLLVWRFLLKLPENHDAFTQVHKLHLGSCTHSFAPLTLVRQLLKKGPHTSFQLLHCQYSSLNRHLYCKLDRVLSALAHWSPVFAEVPYLPALAFPFVKLFEGNELAAFETVMCVLLHWGSGWLETLPHAPIPLLCMVEGLLKSQDQQLHRHFVEVGISAQVYAWCLIRSLFAEVLSRQDWLVLWDHLFSHAKDPSLLLFAALAYLKYFRSSLLAAKTVSDVEGLLHNQVQYALTMCILSSPTASYATRIRSTCPSW